MVCNGVLDVMNLVTAKEMQLVDNKTIESFGLPGRILMENAGRGASKLLFNMYPQIYNKYHVLHLPQALICRPV